MPENNFQVLIFLIFLSGEIIAPRYKRVFKWPFFCLFFPPLALRFLATSQKEKKARFVSSALDLFDGSFFTHTCEFVICVFLENLAEKAFPIEIAWEVYSGLRIWERVQKLFPKKISCYVTQVIKQKFSCFSRQKKSLVYDP